MSPKKFYAVVKGRKPGIYHEWFGARGAEVQIRGFAGAVFKGFTSRTDAEAWLSKLSSGETAEDGTMPLFSTGETELRKDSPRRREKTVADEEISPPAGDAIIIYSDGGCKKNPGPGGYGVVILRGGGREELSGGYARTTNNRMELTGCIKGLEALDEQSSVVVHTDSQYVVNGMMKGWAKRWRRNNWMRNGDEPAENSDLWEKLLALCERHDVRFQWVRGHNGDRENERCDALAVEMTHRRDLPPDHGYGRK